MEETTNTKTSPFNFFKRGSQKSPQQEEKKDINFFKRGSQKSPQQEEKKDEMFLSMRGAAARPPDVVTQPRSRDASPGASPTRLRSLREGLRSRLRDHSPHAPRNRDESPGASPTRLRSLRDHSPHARESRRVSGRFAHAVAHA